MKPRLGGERGVILAQVLVLAVLLGSIAVMLIQWQYGRYVQAYKAESSRRSRDIVQAVVQQQLSGLITGMNLTAPNTPTVVQISDPSGMTCKVTIWNSGCAAGYTFCATYDPCSNCQLPGGGNPCL